MKKENGTGRGGASSTPERIMRGVGVLLWAALIGLFLLNRDKITVESILERTPGNPWEAVPLMMLFFAVKGMSMVLYAGILYTASGLLFPLPLAVAVNLAGTAVMVTVPWLCGRFVGGDAAARFDAKYPAAARIASFREKNDWLFSLGVRMLGGLPSDPLSLYLGAVRLDWPAPPDGAERGRSGLPGVHRVLGRSGGLCLRARCLSSDPPDQKEAGEAEKRGIRAEIPPFFFDFRRARCYNGSGDKTESERMGSE